MNFLRYNNGFTVIWILSLVLRYSEKQSDYNNRNSVPTDLSRENTYYMSCEFIFKVILLNLIKYNKEN